MAIEIVVSLSQETLAVLRELGAALAGAGLRHTGAIVPAPADEQQRLGGRREVAAVKKRKKPDRPRTTSGWRTPDRAVKLPPLWRRGVLSVDIKTAFDADGGPPVPHKQLIGIWAAELGAKRPKDFDPRVSTPIAMAAPDPAPPSPPAAPFALAPVRNAAINESVNAAMPPAPLPPPAVRKAIAPTAGPLSVASRMSADDIAAQTDCPIIWADALEWGIRHRPNGFDRPTNLKDVQAIRAYHHLPPYRLIKPRAPAEALPETNLIEPETIAARAAA